MNGTTESSTFRFTARDVATGAVFTLLYLYVLIVGIVALVAAGFAAASGVVLRSGGGDDGGSPADIAANDLLGIVVIAAIVLIVAMVTTAIAVALLGCVAGLLSLALRRVRGWGWHVASYFALGTIGALAVLVAVFLPGLDFGSPGAIAWLPAVVLAMALTGAAAAAGWMTAWRITGRPAPGDVGDINTLAEWGL